jgi:23S rRNA (cytidine2498-2'-O)-methyltransferase
VERRPPRRPERRSPRGDARTKPPGNGGSRTDERGPAKGNRKTSSDRSAAGNRGAPEGNRKAPGSHGAFGNRNAPAERGASGDRGAKSNRGAFGNRNAPAERGAPGDRGAKSNRGAFGNRNAPAERGASGDRGAKTNRGAFGNRNAPAERGASGDRGAKGNRGASGDRGAKGNRGAFGNRNAPADRGAPASRGASGDRGAKGNRGAFGNRNAPAGRGASGDRGAKGNRGASGNRAVTAERSATGSRAPAGKRNRSGNRTASDGYRDAAAERPVPIAARIVGTPKGPPPPEPRRDATLPRTGEWLWTTRPGSETDLVDELFLEGEREARIIAPAVVVSGRAPRKDGRVELTFARQAFPVSRVVTATSPASLGVAAASALARDLASSERYALQVWVPDSDETNPLAQDARLVEEAAAQRLAYELPRSEQIDVRDSGSRRMPVAQICMLAAGRAVVGVLDSDRALSLFPGGRSRVKVSGDRPSRAARKLAEAFAWLGVAPEPGELCVDLGAAPGGWTWVLLERRTRVVAVDPAKLRPELMERRGLTYVAGNAFDYTPDEPVDWLFCDMAFRPLEVAKMLARWARERSATMLVSNFKLPMRRKAEIVRDVIAILREGGWNGVRVRQLYHDRDEVTVTARLA